MQRTPSRTPPCSDTEDVLTPLTCSSEDGDVLTPTNESEVSDVLTPTDESEEAPSFCTPHLRLRQLPSDLPQRQLQQQEELEPEDEASLGRAPIGQGAFRGKFLQKLVHNNVWVPRAYRPPKHQSVFVFDWDDTLLCTSWLTRQQQPPAETFGHLREIARHVGRVLEVALKSGHTYIITNAVSGWVECSAARWLPELLPVLEQVEVISARDWFEADFPDDMHQWKVRAFLEVQRRLAQTPVTNLVVLGDAHFEMDAGKIMAGKFQEAVIKTVKFRQQPTSLEHLKQLELVAQKFQQIVLSGRNLKVVLERRQQAKHQPGT